MAQSISIFMFQSFHYQTCLLTAFPDFSKLIHTYVLWILDIGYIKNIILISLIVNSYFAELEDQKENFSKVTRNPGYTAKDVMLVALLLENFILHLNLQKANWVYKHIILKNMKNWVCNFNFL